jgi:hypothetical protein
VNTGEETASAIRAAIAVLIAFPQMLAHKERQLKREGLLFSFRSGKLNPRQTAQRPVLSQ